MKVTVDVAAESLRGLLKPQDVNVALRDAVNKTDVHFKARAARAIGDTINARIAAIKDQFKVDRATAKDPESTVTVVRDPHGVGLYKYMTAAQISAAQRRPPGGVRVRVRTGGTIEQHPHSFAAKMRSGHIGIFHRGNKSRAVPGAQRQPIYEEYGPTTVGVLANAPDSEMKGDTIIDASVKDGGEFLANAISGQIDRFLDKYAQQK